MDVVNQEDYANEIIAKIGQLKVSGHFLTDDQKKGMYKLAMWLPSAIKEAKRNPENPPIFRLFGLAGCGKTTCSIAVKLLGFNPLYIAFTNRAVAQLESKGSTPCQTIHSVLYLPTGGEAEDSPEEIAARQAYLDAVLSGVAPADRPPVPKKTNSLSFEMKEKADIMEAVAGYSCIVVDEASMVGYRHGKDLMKIGLPIIGIGDPGQLRPVGDKPFFNPRGPDVLLKKVLRTDGDILELATHVRHGGLFNDMEKGEDFEVRRKAPPEWFDVEQVLCGIHAKRRELNKHIRKLKGYEGFAPGVGEKICVMSNNKVHEMYNGGLWTVTASELNGEYVTMDLLEYAPRKDPKSLETREHIQVHIACFINDVKDREEVGLVLRPASVVAAWGYAITVHKAQGSEWNSVLMFDDGHVFPDESKNWRYTGVTRAAKKLYVVSRH